MSYPGGVTAGFSLDSYVAEPICSREDSLLIDVHAHIHDDSFANDRHQVLERSGEFGVRAVLAVGEGLADNRQVLAVAAQEAAVYPCIGLHPDRFEDFQLDLVVQQIEQQADSVIALGEVGLDYWRAKEEVGRACQRQALIAIVDLARRFDLPVNVHSRSAGHHTLELLREQGAPRIHMHAFDGKASYALAAAEEGVFFSIPPSLLRSPQKQKLARRLPLSQLLLESDAPVLGPKGGERNEPANLRLTLAWIATERGIPEQELDQIIEENTFRAFPRLRSWMQQRGSQPA